MSKHVHNWVLINTYDSKKPRKKSPPPIHGSFSFGLFGGSGYIDQSRSIEEIREDIIESINESYLPQITSETWACECGEKKTNHHKEPSLMERLSKQRTGRV